MGLFFVWYGSAGWKQENTDWDPQPRWLAEELNWKTNFQDYKRKMHIQQNQLIYHLSVNLRKWVTEIITYLTGTVQCKRFPPLFPFPLWNRNSMYWMIQNIWTLRLYSSRYCLTKKFCEENVQKITRFFLTSYEYSIIADSFQPLSNICTLVPL